MKGIPEPDQFWAKLRQSDDGVVRGWHSLQAHSADVAAVTEALLQDTVFNERLARLNGWDELSSAHVSRLSALAALHDAGKVNHLFQEQAFPDSPQSRGHVRPIVDVLGGDPLWHDKLLAPLGIEQILDLNWFEDDVDLTHHLLATWSHHGEPVGSEGSVSSTLWEPNDRRDPILELERLGKKVRSWFPGAFEEAPPFPKGKSEFQHAYNGLLTLADWIGSSFPFEDHREGDKLERARRLTRSRLRNQGLLAQFFRGSLDRPVEFSGILRNEEWTPHAIQQATLDHPVHSEGGLSVLESDTGSGKTEAAIARFFRLYRDGHVDGMYFAVPTRTAAKQLYTRTDQMVKEVFGRFDAEPPPVVQAVPGYYKVDGVEGTPVAPFEVRWHDDREEDAIRERRWAAEGPKRYLSGAIVVGTIDQALLSALQVRHVHMRGAALLRHFLVVDEVHASDVYMTELLEAVLAHHLGAGGHALLMSATLGTDTRLRLMDRSVRGADDVPGPSEALSTGYPSVAHVGSDRTEPKIVETKPTGYQKRVDTSTEAIAGEPQTIAKLGADAAREGARVLIIRNLVRDCVAVQEALEEELCDERHLLFGLDEETPVPHHSRFANEDRSRLDDAIERAFGAVDDDGMAIPIEGVVAVATQTVQMSLDISASLLITDLCPVDVLLQRIGRLHRHGRTHPGRFHEPRCVVLTPESREMGEWIVRGGEMDGKALRGPHGLGTVYSDLRVLEATRRLVEGGDELKSWTIPDNNRDLVERGTNPHALRSIVAEFVERNHNGGAWKAHQNWVEGERYADVVTAEHVLVQRDKCFGYQQFREDLEKVKTRLGQDDVNVELPEGIVSPLVRSHDGTNIDRISIPEHLLLDDGGGNVEFDDMEATDVEVNASGIEFDVAGKRFRYDRMGLDRIEDD